MKNYILSALVSLIVINTALAEEVTLIVKEYESDKYIKIVVDSSEVDAIIESETYQSVEKDIWVKSPTPVIKKRVVKSSPSTPQKPRSKSSSNIQSADEQEPNDPDFQFQYYFKNKGLNPGEFIQVKAPFLTPDGSREWMWVEILSWQGTRIKGLLKNEPYNIPSLKGGSEVVVNQEDVFDYIRKLPDGSSSGNETGALIEKYQN